MNPSRALAAAFALVISLALIGAGAVLPPGGTNGQVQFNSNGSFGADSNLNWDNTNKRLNIGAVSGTGPFTVTGPIRSTANSFLGADQSITSSTALTNINNLTSGTLLANKVYQFEIVVTTTSATAGGVQFDLNGGTATMQAIQATGILIDGTGTVSRANTTSLTGVICTSSTATASQCSIKGAFSVNAGGTFIPRFAQNTSNATSTTAKALSYMLIWQMN